MQQVCSQEDLLTQLIWPNFVDAGAERWAYFWILTTAGELHLCNLLKFTSEEVTLLISSKKHNKP